MSSADASRMKKTRVTNSQPSKPAKVHPPIVAAKSTPTADQVRLQRLISTDSDRQDYSHNAEVKGKVHKVMDVTGMNEEDVFDALETCNFDEEQAITRLVEAGPTGGQWKTTGKKKKGKGGERQTDRDIDAIAAPGYSKANGFDKELDKREITNRQVAKSTRENYGGYVTVTERSQSDRGSSGRGVNGRQSRGGYHNRGGRGGRTFTRGRGRGGPSFGSRERDQDRPGQTGGFGRTPKTETTDAAVTWSPNLMTTDGEDWDTDKDVSAAPLTTEIVKELSNSPVPPVEDEPTLSYENANGSEDIFTGIPSAVAASPSVELTLPYSNTPGVPSNLSSNSHLAGLHQDPAILSVVSSQQPPQQPRIRRVIKKGPSEIPTAAVEMPLSKYRTDLSDQFSNLGIGFGSSPTKMPGERVTSVADSGTPSAASNFPVTDSHLSLNPSLVANKLDNDVEVRASLTNNPIPSESTAVNMETAVSQFSPVTSPHALGGLVGSPTTPLNRDELRQIHSGTSDNREVSDYVSLSGASPVSGIDAVSLSLSAETTTEQSQALSEPVVAAKPSQIGSSAMPTRISLPTASSGLDIGGSQSALNPTVIPSTLRSTAGITTATTSQAMTARTSMRSVPPPGMYQSAPTAPFLLPGAMPYMGYPMDYGELMRLQTPMSTRDMSGVSSSTGLAVDSKYSRDATSGLLNPLYYPSMYMPPVFGLPYGMNFNPYQVPGKPGTAAQFSQAGNQNFIPQGVPGYEDGDFSKSVYGTGQGSVKGVNAGVQHRSLGSAGVSGGEAYKSQTYDGSKGGYGHSTAAYNVPPSNQGLLAGPYLTANFPTTTVPQQYQQLHGGTSAVHAQMMPLDQSAHGAGGGHSGRTQHGSVKPTGKYGSYDGSWQTS